MSDIVERLNALDNVSDAYHWLAHEAAEEIVRLREYVAELDEANRKVSDTNEKLRKKESYTYISLTNARALNKKLMADKAAWKGVQQGTADVVKQLEKEIEKLRAALKPSQELIERMAKAMWRCAVDGDGCTDEEAIMISDDDWHQFLDYARAAAAALKETGDE